MKRPSTILLLVLDSARADRFSSYGYHRRTTPAIDALAREGTVFLRHYAAGSETLPAHVSMFTGIPAAFHSAPMNLSVYDGRFPMLSSILGGQGFETVAVSNNPMIGPGRGFVRGFTRYHAMWQAEADGEPDIVDRVRALVRHDNIAGRALKSVARGAFNWCRAYRFLEPRRYAKRDKGGAAIVARILEELERQSETGTRMFIFANFLETHFPHLPPEPFRHRFFQGPIPWRLLDAMYQGYAFMDGRIQLSARDLDVHDALYDGGLEFQDYVLKPLLEYLESSGRLDETLLIITSDHGELLGRHGLIGHGDTTYEELAHIPLIIRYPARFRPGHREKRLTHATDLFPTILAAVGVSPETTGTLDLASDSFRVRDDRVVVVDDPPIAFPERLRKYPRLLQRYNIIERAIIAWPWKYVWCSSGMHRLFNLEGDPGEQHDLYQSSGTDLVGTLHSKLLKWYEERCPPGQTFDLERYDFVAAWWDRLSGIPNAVVGGEDGADARVIARLKDLGYLE